MKNKKKEEENQSLDATRFAVCITEKEEKIEPRKCSRFSTFRKEGQQWDVLRRVEKSKTNKIPRQIFYNCLMRVFYKHESSSKEEAAGMSLLPQAVRRPKTANNMGDKPFAMTVMHRRLPPRHVRVRLPCMSNVGPTQFFYEQPNVSLLSLVLPLLFWCSTLTLWHSAQLACLELASRQPEIEIRTHLVISNFDI